MFTVFVRGLEFYAYHGVPDEEQVVGHRYSVDLELEIEGDADQSDEISGTVDYGAMAQEVVQLAQRCQVRTVERLARRLGEHVLDRYDSVRSVKVRVAKRLPPAPVIADEAGVALTVHRGVSP